MWYFGPNNSTITVTVKVSGRENCNLVRKENVETMKKSRLGKRFGAWLLTVVMAVSMIPFQAEVVKAAEDMTLTVSSTPQVVNSSGQVEIEIAAPGGYGTIQSLLDEGYTKLEIGYNIASYNQSGSGTAGMQPYFAYGSSWTYETGGVWKNFSDGAIGTVTLDFSSTSHANEQLQRFGLQLANLTGSISYSITSAKLIYTGTTSGGTGGGTTGGETSGDVTATVSMKSGNMDWAEYNYSVTNGTESAISGIKIKVPYTGTVNNLQSWNCSASQSDGYIVISHTAVLAAGQTYSCIGSEEIKFGFAGGASLGTPVVEFVYGEDGGGTSSSELKYELTGEVKDLAAADTPFGKHGKLKLATVSGYAAPIIVDQNGAPFQLRGASTHGMHWNEMHPYVNKGSFQSLRDEWGVNMVRLVSYVTQGGYTEGSQDLLDTKIQEGVAAATELGMYVIIDWHIHAENPHTTKANAEAFFQKYATMYKDYDNVIFEICNEPTGVVWYNGSGSDLYSYCKDIAQIIRDCGSNALIVCGTNTWSQDVDEVAQKPLKDDGFENILYTFHFYSGSHYDDKMNKVKTATAAGTPIFVTEFGICDASGNGGFDTANADAWIKLLDEYNISYACWSLCNKNESASYLSTSCTKTTGGWVEADLATTGKWLVNTYRAHEDADNHTDTTVGDFSISVDPAGGVLADVEAGYTDAGKAVITVKNTGGKELTNLSAKLALGTHFEIVKDFSSTTLAAGESTAIEVALKAGKAAGTYADTITIQSGTIKKVQNVKQVVTEESQPDNPTPDDPTPDNPTPDNPTPDDPTPDNPTPDNPTQDDPTVDDPTPDNPTSDDSGNNEKDSDETQPVKAESISLQVNVKGAGIVPLGSSYKLAPKKTMQIHAALLPENAKQEELTYTSSNTKVASVDENGKVTAKKAGTTVITVSSENGLEKTFKVQVVKKPIKKIKLTGSKTMKVNKKQKLKVTVTPGKKYVSTNYVFKSSNESVATVSSTGQVKAIKKGKAKITVCATDGSGKKASITIQVK